MSHSENLDRGVVKFPARSRGCGIIHDVKPMDGHVRIVTWPDVRIRCQGVTLSGPRNPGGPEMCKNGDFVKNPQIWPKMPKLSKMAKTVILAKTPKMTKKQRFFGSVQKCSARALTCGETRRIIYCLDTRYGPQNGGFGPPGGWDGLHRNREIRENANLRISVKTGFFGFCRNTGKPSIQNVVGRWSRRGPG